jgi:hypothetical protein
MSLIRCAECKAKISNKASACPKCGAPIEIATNKRKGRISAGWAFLILLIVTISIINIFKAIYQDDRSTTSTSPASQRAPSIRLPNFEIINDETFLDYKRTLDIRLKHRVSEDNLRKIAIRLKRSDTNEYERTFITYYLPGMKVGTGAVWASSHFNPNLEVRFFGLTKQEVETLSQKEIEQPDEKIIGRWLDEVLTSMEGRITIYQKGDQLFMRKVYKDGSVGNDECVKYRVGKQTRIKKKRDKLGDYFVIDAKGYL